MYPARLALSEYLPGAISSKAKLPCESVSVVRSDPREPVGNPEGVGVRRTVARRSASPATLITLPEIPPFSAGEDVCARPQAVIKIPRSASFVFNLVYCPCTAIKSPTGVVAPLYVQLIGLSPAANPAGIVMLI